MTLRSWVGIKITKVWTDKHVAPTGFSFAGDTVSINMSPLRGYVSCIDVYFSAS